MPNILYIENQSSQFDAIQKYFNEELPNTEFTIYPQNSDEYSTLLTTIRIILNPHYSYCHTKEECCSLKVCTTPDSETCKEEKQSRQNTALKKLVSNWFSSSSENKIDLIITDYKLGGPYRAGNGIDLIDKIFSMSGEILPVIFFSKTSYSNPNGIISQLRKKDLIDNNYEWLEKGFNNSLLLDKNYLKENLLPVINKFFPDEPEAEFYCDSPNPSMPLYSFLEKPELELTISEFSLVYDDQEGNADLINNMGIVYIWDIKSLVNDYKVHEDYERIKSNLKTYRTRVDCNQTSNDVSIYLLARILRYFCLNKTSNEVEDNVFQPMYDELSTTANAKISKGLINLRKSILLGKLVKGTLILDTNKNRVVCHVNELCRHHRGDSS